LGNNSGDAKASDDDWAAGVYAYFHFIGIGGIRKDADPTNQTALLQTGRMHIDGQSSSLWVA